MFFINHNNPDHVAVNSLTNVVFDNVNDEAMAQFDDPNPDWAIIKDCGLFPCTAPDNAIVKLNNATATGTNMPQVTGISSGVDFQIIANNAEAADNMSNCTLVSYWNAYKCFNTNLGQLMFESLDADRKDRMFSPIYYLGEGNSFNNTLNTFMDHCWDGHYTCQERLSRFPGMLELNKNYEIYFTGTQPANTRYTIEGASSPTDYLQIKIDFSKSIVYNVYANDVLISPYTYNRTERIVPAIRKAFCGENRFEESTFTYEFYLVRNCTVKLEAQDHLYGVVRLQMSLNDFFEDDFTNKLSFALGITTDKIKIVGAKEGSTVVSFYLTSDASDSTSKQNHLRELADLLASKHAQGTLDLGAPILDLVTEIVSSSGDTVTSDTGTYKKKEIDTIIYVLLAISGLALLLGITFGIYKTFKTVKSYKQIVNIDDTRYEKGNPKVSYNDQIYNSNMNSDPASLPEEFKSGNF